MYCSQVMWHLRDHTNTMPTDSCSYHCSFFSSESTVSGIKEAVAEMTLDPKVSLVLVILMLVVANLAIAK